MTVQDDRTKINEILLLLLLPFLLQLLLLLLSRGPLFCLFYIRQYKGNFYSTRTRKLTRLLTVCGRHDVLRKTLKEQNNCAQVYYVGIDLTLTGKLHI